MVLPIQGASEEAVQVVAKAAADPILELVITARKVVVVAVWSDASKVAVAVATTEAVVDNTEAVVETTGVGMDLQGLEATVATMIAGGKSWHPIFRVLGVATIQSGSFVLLCAMQSLSLPMDLY